ncbi:MAG TPA: PQQ-dependent dehydrogenase, methanol/ethanol family [Bryobacteraceae bacterium]|jgi:quinohemoprotein ethanol dehydrogenase|nr:PQQ-dependent dehydrogenase, methanol/ethanol family [Bryobacteraceae bacterium]
MRISGLTAALPALGIPALFFALSLHAQQTAKPVNVDGKILHNTGSANDALPGSWLSYGRNQGETRYSTLKQINDSNAKRLGLAWTYAVGAGGGNQEGTPLVWNNTLYGITTWSVVYALDARNGKELWRWDPEINQTAVRPKICCGTVNRGMAIYNGMIIASINDGRLEALDALTGKPVWEARVAFPQELYTVTMAPRIAGDKVIVGASGGDKPTRGFFAAFDAKTGHSAWKFYTVPGNPENPPENDAMKAALKTWGGDFWTKGGGGAVWDGIAYDPEANLIYVGTGNAEPWVQKFRGAQNVDNLYTCSILAVDLTTGQLKWYFQTTPNDNWDFDSVQQLMLLDLKINGKTRKVITQASKNGFFWVLDRLTGEFISGAPFVKTTWATGLTAKGRPIVNPAAYYDKDPIAIFPTGGGAHNWSPMSYSPLTGAVYIPVSLSPFTYAATEELKPGTTGYSRGNGTPKLIDSPAIGPPTEEGMRGALEAWDPVNQKLVWRIEGGGGIGGGTVATAGNLVFEVVNDGRFRAVTADKGEILYEAKTGRTGMAPPITYEVDGKQYVAFQGGMGRPASTEGPNDAKVDYPPLMFVFALDGAAELPKAAPVLPRNNNNRPAPPTAPELAK